MTHQDALMDILRKLFELDDRERRAGLSNLRDQDRSWDEWLMELRARVSYMAADGPSQELLNVVGAFVVSMKLRLAAQEEVQVGSAGGSVNLHQCEATTLSDERCIRPATHTYQRVAGRVEYLCWHHAPLGLPNTKRIES
jgi:hypothetical protein